MTIAISWFYFISIYALQGWDDSQNKPLEKH